jgi:hypothetical protein
LCQRLGQPASLLNLAANLMAVDCGGNEATVFAGPVFSHYEFELGPATRMTDAEWKTRIKSGSVPAHPEWTRGFLVPGPFTLPSGL